jgi:sarcosine oxidase gamma subunit
MRRHLILAVLALLAFAPAAGAQTVIVEIEGRSRVLDAAALAALPTATVSVERGGGRVTFTGPLLWQVLAAGGAAPEYALAARLALVVTASDGYTTVLSMGELAPELGNRPVLLGLSADDASIRSFPRIIVPAERRGARGVRDVVRLTVLPVRAP